MVYFMITMLKYNSSTRNKKAAGLLGQHCVMQGDTQSRHLLQVTRDQSNPNGPCAPLLCVLLMR